MGGRVVTLREPRCPIFSVLKVLKVLLVLDVLMETGTSCDCH